MFHTGLGNEFSKEAIQKTAMVAGEPNNMLLCSIYLIYLHKNCIGSVKFYLVDPPGLMCPEDPSFVWSRARLDVVGTLLPSI